MKEKKKREKVGREVLFSHLPPISQTIPVRLTKQAGHYHRTKYKFISEGLP